MSARVLRRELGAVTLALLAVFLGGALVFQHAAPGASALEATGPFGPVGTVARWLLVSAVGVPGAALIAAGLLLVALRWFGRFGGEPDEGSPQWGVLLVGVVALVPVAIGLALGGAVESSSATGLWGGLVAHYLRKALGPAGAWVVFALAASALTVVAARWNPLRVLLGPARSDGGPSPSDPDARVAGGSGLTRAEQLAPAPEEMPAIDPALARDVLAEDRGAPRGTSRHDADTGEEAERARPAPAGPRRGRRTPDDRSPSAVGASTDSMAEGASDERRFDAALPPTTLLTAPPPRSVDAGRRELDAAGAKLMATLRTFKVEGELVGRTTGPSVTQFEIEPAAGVKVRQIAALADDLALAMRAPSIRIVAPIPGRGAVGVEVPNPVPEMVVLRDVLEAPEFQEARAALPVALGKDLEGRPVIADLARMPHLLIAGATGSGKSMCVNTIITSLAYRHTPKTLRFLMVDPKMVELSVYNALPHLRHKVITDNRDAAKVLKWAVIEMQDRYRLLEANACRNLQEFNRRVQQHLDGAGDAPVKPRNLEVAFEDRTYTGGILPYIVVVIDEMADLMMTVQAEVETPIAMLAQKARAIGIHLILATQRPSVNVITGLIKANFPCRIAFRVASQVDSRTIIDGAGAEALLGNGDMLFIPPGKSEPSRLQGAFLSSEDTEQLLRWYTAARARAMAAAGQGEMPPEEPDVLATVDAMEAKARGDEDAGGDEDAAGTRDSRFREAAEVVLQHRQGSTSLLQRRMKIGYGRAARIIDQLEEAGVLAPSEGGAKPRDVLIGAQDLDRICGGGPG
jgi:S-DNA-T family DNA segregation ATPase FtsK/SpoIIIE